MKQLACIALIVCICTACAPLSAETDASPLPQSPPLAEKDEPPAEDSQAATMLSEVEAMLVDCADVPFTIRENPDDPIRWFSIRYRRLIDTLKYNTIWEAVEPSFIPEKDAAIFCGTGQNGYIVFPLEENEADIIFLNTGFDPVAAVKNVHPSEEKESFLAGIKEMFSVLEVDFSQIPVPTDMALGDIPAKMLELYCEQFMGLSSFNPYGITDIEPLSVGEPTLWKDNTEAVFWVEYAVKPKNIHYSDWWAGGGQELLEDGWLMWHVEVTLILDPVSRQWVCVR